MARDGTLTVVLLVGPTDNVLILLHFTYHVCWTFLCLRLPCLQILIAAVEKLYESLGMGWFREGFDSWKDFWGSIRGIIGLGFDSWKAFWGVHSSWKLFWVSIRGKVFGAYTQHG